MAKSGHFARSQQPYWVRMVTARLACSHETERFSGGKNYLRRGFLIILAFYARAFSAVVAPLPTARLRGAMTSVLPVIAHKPTSWPCHLLLQSCRKVRNHRDGLADLLLNSVEKKFLAVGRDVVEDLGSGPIGDQLLSRAEL